jgi:hypothetical protein
VAARAPRCTGCGFVFFDEPSRRALTRPPARLVAAGALLAAVVVAAAVLVTRDPPREPPGPVARAAAEQRLEARLTTSGVEQVGSVRCDASVRPGRTTRCELRYSDGDTQLMLVGVAPDGELDIEVPYPAQRRPGG